MSEYDNSTFEEACRRADAEHARNERARKHNGQDREQQQPRERLIKSSAEFIRGFVAPDYLVHGILQRRFFYSMTALSGGGKTAILLLLAAHNALGRSLGSRTIDKGRVLYLAGENPDDIRMRWIGMSQRIDFDLNTIDVNFIPGVFKISELSPRVHSEAERLGGGFSQIVVDTSAAFFEGTDENDNVQALRHAQMLRGLVNIQGGPTVIAACHPTKNAAAGMLLPRGGGSFLNETDGNLTCNKTDSTIELHWQGKFRGPDFAPIMFKVETVTHQLLKDTKGQLVPTVIASHITDVAQEEMARVALNDENALLKAIADNPSSSLARLATALGWFMRDGEPYKKKVERCAAKLIKQKLVAQERGGTLILTGEGLKAVQKLGSGGFL